MDNSFESQKTSVIPDVFDKVRVPAADEPRPELVFNNIPIPKGMTSIQPNMAPLKTGDFGVCPKCGTKREVLGKFCPECGFTYHESTSKSQ